MRLPALFLLQITCSASVGECHTGTGVYPIRIYSGVLKILNTRTYIDDRHTINRRHKRGTTQFLKAMKEISKTIIGVQPGYIARRQKYEHGMTYLKVGSLDDALEDFYSLGPNVIRNKPYGLSVEIGNMALQLYSTPPQILVITPEQLPMAIAYKKPVVNM